jgi:tetratricopeptide (TPR) repeat protein
MRRPLIPCAVLKAAPSRRRKSQLARAGGKALNLNGKTLSDAVGNCNPGDGSSNPIIFLDCHGVERRVVNRLLYGIYGIFESKTGFMNHQPEIKANSLIKQVESLFDAPERDEFTIAKLKTKAKQLVSTDPFNGKILLGNLAALEHQIVELRNNFESAIKLQPNNPVGISSYAASLDYLGYFSEARELGEKAYRLAEGNPKILSNIIEGSIHSGRYQDAQKYLKKWNALVPKGAHRLSQHIGEVSEFLIFHGILDDSFEKYQKVVSEFMHQCDIYTFEGQTEIIEDEDSACLSIMIETNKSIGEIVQLNFKLAEIMARTDLPENLTANVNYVFVSQY